jgi:hypothetical protein
MTSGHILGSFGPGTYITRGWYLCLRLSRFHFRDTGYGDNDAQVCEQRHGGQLPRGVPVVVLWGSVLPIVTTGGDGGENTSRIVATSPPQTPDPKLIQQIGQFHVSHLDCR